MSEYDLVLLKKIRVLYRCKDDEKIIFQNIVWLCHFLFAEKIGLDRLDHQTGAFAF